jgi:AcrR family transcriptional regulator
VDIGDKGVEALAVEPLAARLAVTKGSFYWHFKDRNALLRAALERWEYLGTEAVIAGLELLPDPRARLRRLFQEAFGGPLHLETAILSAVDDPVVHPIVTRVARRRLDYLVGLYRAAGLPPKEARIHGLHAFSAYLGIQHIIKTMPAAFPPRERARYVEHLGEKLLPPQGQ